MIHQSRSTTIAALALSLSLGCTRTAQQTEDDRKNPLSPVTAPLEPVNPDSINNLQVPKKVQTSNCAVHVEILEKYFQNLADKKENLPQDVEILNVRSQFERPTFLIKDLKTDDQIYLKLTAREDNSDVEWSNDGRSWESIRPTHDKDTSGELRKILEKSDVLDSSVSSAAKFINGEALLVLPPALDIPFDTKIKLFQQLSVDIEKKAKAGGATTISTDSLMEIVSNLHNIFLGTQLGKDFSMKGIREKLFEQDIVLRLEINENRSGISEVSIIKIDRSDAGVVNSKQLAHILPGIKPTDCPWYAAEIFPVFTGSRKLDDSWFHRDKFGVLGTQLSVTQDNNNYCAFVFRKNIERTLAALNNAALSYNSVKENVILNEVAHVAIANSLSSTKQVTFNEKHVNLSGNSEMALPAHSLLQLEEAISDIVTLRLSKNFSSAFELILFSSQGPAQYSLSSAILLNAIYHGGEDYINSAGEDKTLKLRIAEIDTIHVMQNGVLKGLNLPEVTELTRKNEDFLKCIKSRYVEILDLLIKTELPQIIQPQ
jgi:hypothetical protein